VVGSLVRLVAREAIQSRILSMPLLLRMGVMVGMGMQRLSGGGGGGLVHNASSSSRLEPEIAFGFGDRLLFLCSYCIVARHGVSKVFMIEGQGTSIVRGYIAWLAWRRSRGF
jgi:hypothetical protein